MASSSQLRKEKYCTLSNQIALFDSHKINALLGARGPGRGWGPALGWGKTHLIDVGRSKVFVKRIPITAIEHEHLFSTENMHNLPAFYNYGVGSAGFGVFRELIIYIKTTNWVLEGSIDNFPLMYHYRIVPLTGQHLSMDKEEHKGYVNYWNSDKNIDKYMKSRYQAKYEVILFLEYIPHVLSSWLAKNISQVGAVIREMHGAIEFLREKGVIHFDAHFGNILIGDGRPYLADFGLALDKSFSLSPAEQAFFNRHIDYDHAQFFSGIGAYIYTVYKRLPASALEKMKRRYGIDEETGYDKTVAILLERIEDIHSSNVMKLNAVYVEELIRLRELTLCMNSFYADLRGNEKKDTPYPYTKARRLLKDAEII